LPFLDGVELAGALRAHKLLAIGYIHGSNTIGAQLGPALAQAYLRQQGASDVKTISKSPDEVNVQGTVSGSPQFIETAAHGSATAFADLDADKCDIGMASRKITPEERQGFRAWAT
jgi:phosphate transport system substrate-binding protein